mgnify:CR=1 FL=1
MIRTTMLHQIFALSFPSPSTIIDNTKTCIRQWQCGSCDGKHPSVARWFAATCSNLPLSSTSLGLLPRLVAVQEQQQVSISIGLQNSVRFVLFHNKYGFSPAHIAWPSLVQVFPQADADRSRHKQVPEVVHTPSIATYLPKCSLFGKAILQECTVEQQGKICFACCGGRMVPSCPPARRCFQETDRQVSSSSLWSLCTNSMMGSMMALPSVWLLVEWLYYYGHQISRFCFFAEGRASSTLFGSSRRSVLMGPEGGLRCTLRTITGGEDKNMCHTNRENGVSRVDQPSWLPSPASCVACFYPSRQYVLCLGSAIFSRWQRTNEGIVPTNN